MVRENETLTEVKLRIQKKLVISDEEFSKVVIGCISCYFPNPSSLLHGFWILDFSLTLA